MLKNDEQKSFTFAPINWDNPAKGQLSSNYYKTRICLK